MPVSSIDWGTGGTTASFPSAIVSIESIRALTRFLQMEINSQNPHLSSYREISVQPAYTSEFWYSKPACTSVDFRVRDRPACDRGRPRDRIRHLQPSLGLLGKVVLASPTRSPREWYLS